MTHIMIFLVVLFLILFINFTSVESGNFKLITANQTYYKTLRAGEGFFSPLGLYWVGLNFIHRVHSFIIKKEKENPDGTNPSNWLISEGEVHVTDLRELINRAFVMLGIELADRTTLDILVSGIFKVIDPVKFVFGIKASFLVPGSIMRAEIVDQIKDLSNLTEFIAQEKGEFGFLKDMLPEDSKFNQKLLELTGLILISVNIPQFSADTSMIDAANEEAIAKLKASAAVAVAQGQADALNITSTAEAQALKIKAEAEIDGIIAQLKKTGANDKEILSSLTTIMRMKSIEKSNLTSLVEGGSSAISTIPVK